MIEPVYSAAENLFILLLKIATNVVCSIAVPGVVE